MLDGVVVADALTAEVVGVTDCGAVTGGADALIDEVVGATTGVAVVGTGGFATTGLVATAPAVAGLCAKTVEATHNGKTTTPKARPKVWCCVAADLINSDMGFMIKGEPDGSNRRYALKKGFIPTDPTQIQLKIRTFDPAAKRPQ